jgi:cobalt-zinc-cadmium efflux system outer membrane protein
MLESPDRARAARTALAALFLALCLPVAAGAQESYTLEELLRIGRERSPNVLALQAEHSAMEADRRDAGRWQNPELEYEAGRGELYDEVGTKSLSGFTIRQVIENPLTRHYRLGALSAQAEAAGQGVRVGILDVEYEIRLHFNGILYLQELTGLARLNEEALSAIRGLMETRAAVGEVRQLEAIRLRVEHLRARNEMEAAELELDQYRQHLNTILGYTLPGDFTLVGKLTADPGDPSLDDLVSRVLPNHPALLTASRQREAADQQWKGSRVGWLPNPVVTGSTAKELDGDLRMLGVGIQIPLWNQSRAATQRDRERVREMEYREGALLLDLRAQLIIHHNQLLQARRMIQLFQDGLLTEADASMRIAETSYRQGEISSLEYLDARRTFHSIQIEYQQALFDWNRQRAALDRAAGGGTY